MNAFPFDLKKAILIAFIIALPLLSVNIRREGQPALYEKPVQYAAGAVQDVYMSFSQGVRETVRLYIDLIHVKKDFRELQEQNKALLIQMKEMDEVKRENSRMGEMLGFRSKHKMNLIGARVVGIDLFGEHASIRINKGSKDGVQKGHAVITPEGAVGYVLLAGYRTSTILLINDHYAVVDALVQRTRVRGIVEGKTPTTCILKYLQRSDEVQVGDLVVTSGLDNIFPKGFPIGKVTKVEKKSVGITQSVTLEPAVAASQLEEVFVVADAGHEDLLPGELPTTFHPPMSIPESKKP